MHISSTTDANIALVRRYIEEANNGGAIALIDELIAPTYVWHRGPKSREELKQFVAWQRLTAPDWHIAIQDIIAQGDRVAVRANAGGTRTEQMPGVLYPEPRRIDLTWIAIYRIENGQIAEVWVETSA